MDVGKNIHNGSTFLNITDSCHTSYHQLQYALINVINVNRISGVSTFCNTVIPKVFNYSIKKALTAKRSNKFYTKQTVFLKQKLFFH